MSKQICKFHSQFTFWHYAKIWTLLSWTISNPLNGSAPLFVQFFRSKTAELLSGRLCTCSRSCSLPQRLVLRYQDFPDQLSLLCIARPPLYSIVLELGSKISEDKLGPFITISLTHCWVVLNIIYQLRQLLVAGTCLGGKHPSLLLVGGSLGGKPV